MTPPRVPVPVPITFEFENGIKLTTSINSTDKISVILQLTSVHLEISHCLNPDALSYWYLDDTTDFFMKNPPDSLILKKSSVTMKDYLATSAEKVKLSQM